MTGTKFKQIFKIEFIKRIRSSIGDIQSIGGSRESQEVAKRKAVFRFIPKNLKLVFFFFLNADRIIDRRADIGQAFGGTQERSSSSSCPPQQ